jgi:hypothetical protein
MLRKFVRVLAVLLTVGTGLSPGQPQSSLSFAANLKIMGFELGKSTLADVEAKLGKSPVKKCSHDEETSKEVCYVSARDDQTRVVFEAGFSGGWKRLDGYKVMGGGSVERCYRECPRSTEVTSEAQAESGLKLGLGREQLIALLGAPMHVQGNNLNFQQQSRQTMTRKQAEAAGRTFKSPAIDSYYDVQDSVDVTLAGSKVVEFEVRHVVTY